MEFAGLWGPRTSTTGACRPRKVGYRRKRWVAPHRCRIIDIDTMLLVGLVLFKFWILLPHRHHIEIEREATTQSAQQQNADGINVERWAGG
jgi:hypothetical protein